MTEVQAEQLKLVGTHNTKKIFSTEKLLLRASSFLFQIKYSHCENNFPYESYDMTHIICYDSVVVYLLSNESGIISCVNNTTWLVLHKIKNPKYDIALIDDVRLSEFSQNTSRYRMADSFYKIISLQILFCINIIRMKK